MQNITSQMLEEIVRKVVAEQMVGTKEPHRHVDLSGVIGVQVAKIVTEHFDTGKSGDMVKLKDLFSLDESPRIGAGVMELDHTTFDWTLTYDEVDYVIEGTLEIIIDGRKVVGKAGDVIFIPKETKIQFSTPDFTRFLYVVYPANWAEKV